MFAFFSPKTHQSFSFQKFGNKLLKKLSAFARTVHARGLRPMARGALEVSQPPNYSHYIFLAHGTNAAHSKSPSYISQFVCVFLCS